MIEEDVLGKAYDGRLMRRFLGYLRPHWKLVALSLLLIFVRIAIDLVGPLILRWVVDGPVARRDHDGLLLGVLLLAASTLGFALLEFAETWVTNLAGQRIIRDLRMQVYAHLQRLPMPFFDRNPVGRLVVRITGDVENLNELFTSGFVSFFSDLFLIAGILIMMFVVSWKMTLLCLSVAPLVALGLFFFRAFARESYREIRRRIARLNAYLNESINGVRTIQTFTREEHCTGKFRALNDEFRAASNRAILFYSFFFPGVELLSATAVAALVWYGGLSIAEGVLTFGSFLAFWNYAQKFFQPIRDLSEKYNILQAAMASSERLFGLLDTPAEPGGGSVRGLRGEIAFENVSFSYDGKTPVLRDVSFRVRAGERIAVVGLTGGGKTTLINLLLRMYEPESGRILVDGRDVRELDPREWRRSVGLVLQDVFLFNGTVEDNIRLGRRDLPQDRIREAARIAGADGFIAALPGGYAMDIRERGSALSTGQRQLLSFARAAAGDPRVLILDEATSNIDSEHEALIGESLKRLLGGRTSLVIAHRLSTIRDADRILVLHQGRVAEEGTHQELLRRDGLYSKLYALQFEVA